MQPKDEQQYHYQKKYHDLYSTQGFNQKADDRSEIEIMAKKKSSWLDNDEKVKREDQRYSKLFGQEKLGRVKDMARTKEDGVHKDNWITADQNSHTDNTGTKFHGAFQNKQKDLSSGILGSNYMKSYLNKRVSKENKAKNSGLTKKNELSHQLPFQQ